jgi:serine phosphatase RsbU (regulator of sigma subunit)
VDWTEGRCRITLIDGLGHGIEAAEAAQHAAAVLRERPELSPSEALHLSDRVLRGMRGAAMGVATVDLAGHRLTFAGIGNVEGRLWQETGAERLISYRGIVGMAMRSVRIFEYELGPAWTLIMHTDGVSARFNDQLASAHAASLEAVADAILQGWARQRDDATVVLVRPRAGQ